MHACTHPDFWHINSEVVLLYLIMQDKIVGCILAYYTEVDIIPAV